MPMFQCDRKGQTKFGTRAEIKNINSFRFVERAINFEVERKLHLLKVVAKSFKKLVYMIPIKMKRVPCAAKKKPMIIAIFLIPIYCRW